jgi:hypothetical protein
MKWRGEAMRTSSWAVSHHACVAGMLGIGSEAVSRTCQLEQLDRTVSLFNLTEGLKSLCQPSDSLNGVNN